MPDVPSLVALDAAEAQQVAENLGWAGGSLAASIVAYDFTPIAVADDGSVSTPVQVMVGALGNGQGYLHLSREAALRLRDLLTKAVS